MRIALMLLMLMPTPAAWAQSPASQPAAAQDVTIIIQQQQVRFTTRSAVAEMQLKVFDQTGEMVYDSGVVTEPELNWPLQDANGNTVKSGLYAYTLSIKEAGAETASVRRGHFIVDRAQDRDGADKLWVTSQNSSGVGTELTVARDENATVAGATTSGERTLEVRGESRKRESGDRNVEGEQKTKSEMKEAGGRMILQGSDDPLLVINHTGTAFNPAIHFQQDGVPKAFLWWDQFNRRLNLGTPAKNPILALQDNGKVGIGTDTPASTLDIRTSQDGLRIFGYQPFLTLTDSSTGRRGRIQSANGSIGFQTESDIAAGVPAQVEVLNYVDPNTPRLLVKAQNGLETVGYEPFLTLNDSANNAYRRIRIQDVNGDFNFQTHSLTVHGGSAMVIKDGTYNVGIGTPDPQAKLDVVGRTRTGSLEITGGADFAENFDVNVETTGGEKLTAKVEAGLVVSIDPANPGKLQLSTQAYDYQVAGIISGAGGVKPGMMMSQDGTLAHGQHPVALSGRVYCWADASNGPIKPGDLLTTSDTPGHAMKVTDRVKAQGAIIGKAMTGLKEGKGLVLVLVTLQ